MHVLRGIILFFCLLGSAVTQAQENRMIRFPEKRMILGEAFAQIEHQSGMSIAYNEVHLDLNRVVPTDIASASLTEVLDYVLKAFDVSYKIVERQILIIKRPGGGKTRLYQGFVTNESAEPIAGASVLIKGMTTGTTTNEHGAFQLSAAEGSILQISFLGYQPQELRMDSHTHLTVRLKEDSQKVDEVVVVGYGTLQKRDVSSSIGTYKR